MGNNPLFILETIHSTWRGVFVFSSLSKYYFSLRIAAKKKFYKNNFLSAPMSETEKFFTSNLLTEKKSPLQLTTRRAPISPPKYEKYTTSIISYTAYRAPDPFIKQYFHKIYIKKDTIKLIKLALNWVPVVLRLHDYTNNRYGQTLPNPAAEFRPWDFSESWLVDWRIAHAIDDYLLKNKRSEWYYLIEMV